MFVVGYMPRIGRGIEYIFGMVYNQYRETFDNPNFKSVCDYK